MSTAHWQARLWSAEAREPPLTPQRVSGVLQLARNVLDPGGTRISSAAPEVRFSDHRASLFIPPNSSGGAMPVFALEGVTLGSLVGFGHPGFLGFYQSLWVRSPSGQAVYALLAVGVPASGPPQQGRANLVRLPVPLRVFWSAPESYPISAPCVLIVGRGVAEISRENEKTNDGGPAVPELVHSVNIEDALGAAGRSDAPVICRAHVLPNEAIRAAEVLESEANLAALVFPLVDWALRPGVGVTRRHGHECHAWDVSEFAGLQREIARSGFFDARTEVTLPLQGTRLVKALARVEIGDDPGFGRNARPEEMALAVAWRWLHKGRRQPGLIDTRFEQLRVYVSEAGPTPMAFVTGTKNFHERFRSLLLGSTKVPEPAVAEALLALLQVTGAVPGK